MTANELESTLEKVSRVITDRYGLRLVCEGDSCRTDGKTIYLPSLPENMPEELLGAIRGWADHECAHAIFTETELGPAFQQEHGPLAFGILNTLEDARVERLMARRYPGSSINLREAFRFVSERASVRPTQDPFRQFTSALYVRASGRPNQDWVTRRAYALAEECAEELSALHCCRDTRQVAVLGLKVWEKVKERFSQEAQQTSSSEDPQPDGAGPSGEAPKAQRRPMERPQRPKAPPGRGRTLCPLEAL